MDPITVVAWVMVGVVVILFAALVVCAIFGGIMAYQAWRFLSED